MKGLGPLHGMSDEQDQRLGWPRLEMMQSLATRSARSQVAVTALHRLRADMCIEPVIYSFLCLLVCLPKF